MWFYRCCLPGWGWSRGVGCKDQAGPPPWIDQFFSSKSRVPALEHRMSSARNSDEENWREICVCSFYYLWCQSGRPGERCWIGPCTFYFVALNINKTTLCFGSYRWSCCELSLFTGIHFCAILPHSLYAQYLCFNDVFCGSSGVISSIFVWVIFVNDTLNNHARLWWN